MSIGRVAMEVMPRKLELRDQKWRELFGVAGTIDSQATGVLELES